MPLIIPSNSISAGGYDVDNSLRFDDGSSDYLNRTPSSAGNRKTFTFSTWIKKSDISNLNAIFSSGANSLTNGYFSIVFDATTGLLRTYIYESSTYREVKTNAYYRDLSAWYHLVVAVDTTQSTASNRIKFYINGSQVTDLSLVNSGYPTQNTDFSVNNTLEQRIGVYRDSGGTLGSYWNGYMAEFILIDGQALDPTSFGEFDEDSGIWKPIDVSGLTFGTNGVYFDFENSGSLGADVSGNGNDFTVNNLTAIDQTTDTPTNNFATLNPLAVPSASNTFSEGNLEITNSADANRSSFSTIGVSSGKWYYECKVLSGEMKQFIGISKPQEATIRPGDTAGSYGYSAENGQKYNNDSGSSYGSSASSGDIIMVAFDADNGTIWVGKNGTWFNSATQSEIENGTTTNSMYSSITIDDFFMMAVSVEDSNVQMNFGSPMYSISSGNTDGNGYGNFEYEVPDSYLSLCSANLSEVLG